MKKSDSSQFQIRNATPSDAESIAAIGICGWASTYTIEGISPGFSRFILNEFHPSRMEHRIQTEHVYVLEKSGHLSGFMSLSHLSGQESEIKTLHILPLFQGQGLGKRLIEFTDRLAVNTLWLLAWEKNPNAHQFYRSCGFCEDTELVTDSDGFKFRRFFKHLHQFHQ